MNNDNKKKVESGSTPESQNHTPGAMKRFLGKKWVFPGIYLTAAALILAFMVWFQGQNDEIADNDLGIEVTDNTNVQDDGAAPVTAETEDLYVSPYSSAQDLNVTAKVNFYDDNASVEERQAAMVMYDGTYKVHTGIDYTIDGKQTFDVVAAKTGTVVRAEKDPLVGFIVEIEHQDGLVSVYQSLENVTVSVGDEVAQGMAFAQAGANKYEKDMGVHLHFELRKDNVAVNPHQFFAGEGAVSSTEDSASTNDAVETSSNPAANDEKAAEQLSEQ